MIYKKQSKHWDVRAKQQARLIRDVRNSKLVSATLVSNPNTSGNYSKCDRESENVRVFLFKVAFDIIERDLDQHSRLLSTIRVFQQRYLNVLIMDCQKSRGPVACDPGKLHDQNQLYAVLFVRESCLCRGI